MRRREFMTRLAGAGAGLAWMGQAAAEDPAAGEVVSANARIRVALIGARNMGGKTHLPTLLHQPECHLTAICDVDRTVLDDALATARRTYGENEQVAGDGGVKGYGDFRDVLQREDIDAVLIATPDHWHVPLAKAAILAGKDVYVEKPLSLFVNEGRELAALTAERKAIVQVGSQHRSSDRFFLAAAAVQSGLLGEARDFEVRFNTREGNGASWDPQPVPPELDYNRWLGTAPWTGYHPERVHYNFRFVSDFSGGDITNWGGHFLDNIQQILGMDDSGPVSIVGRGERHPAGALHSSFFNVDVDFEYAGGVSVRLRSGPPGIHVTGSRASLYVNRNVLKTDPPELLRDVPRDAARALRRTRGSHLQNWLACVRSRRAEDLHAPVEVGHRSATVCHLANIAVELGRPLTWVPEREIFNDDAHANALLNRPERKDWET